MLYMPRQEQDGHCHWLASFEVIPPPQKLVCTGSAATATLPVHAGENLGVIKYERWKRRQGSIVAPMATKPTLPDGMCLPTGKPA